MQPYTLPAVKSCLLMAAPRGLLTQSHKHTHWGNREGTKGGLLYSGPVFCWVKIQEGQATQATQRKETRPFYRCLQHSPAQVEEGDLRKAISPTL